MSADQTSRRAATRIPRRSPRRPLQLLIYHFMFDPEYAAGCPVCSSIADNLNANLPSSGRAT
ncbi:MAG TPA: DUF899 family protein [Thermoleophilaceae bacterium]|nr:DUF899 family protein [Thermoleophilaceae bacterium]